MASGSSKASIQSPGQQQNESHTSAQNQGQFSGSRNVRETISKAVAQYTTDARLHVAYEQSGESGKSFDYSQSVKTDYNSVPEEQIVAYMSKIQRGVLFSLLVVWLLLMNLIFKLLVIVKMLEICFVIRHNRFLVYNTSTMCS
ncbi:hypothetical protein POM88_037121 [Heracleum sosnowskyi]|uniref:Uncharacterized protein n=1 Tax=Heracleum sosnowskyi TaxID=360622 RepID=A0AAD8MFN1_9APIA|nr:hypothetical protein POM88_037121 [Heracleum sosnowskyi]